MQKKIIALAVAGLVSGAAFAQSNLTVYGQVDEGFTRATANGQELDTKTGINSGLWASSRLGFKGQEDLGNGLKAIFTLEYGLTADDNSGVGVKDDGSGNARETTVGLTGGFGTFKAGRQTTLGHAAINKFDATRATYFSPLSNFRASSISNSSRADNTAVYISPNLSGFTMGASYTLGDADSSDTAAYDSKQARILGLSADYTNGPIAVAYVYHKQSDKSNVSGTDTTENLIAGSYDFRVVKLLATFQTQKDEMAAAVTTNKDRIYQVGVQVPVGAKAAIDASYAMLDDRDAADADSKSYGIQGSYNLSKRTMAYAGYTHVSNDNGAAEPAMGTTVGVTPGAVQSSSGFGVGIRHTF